MRTEQLLHRLQLEAAAESERAWRQRNYEAAHPTVTAQAVEEQKISRICTLRKQAAEARFQLELDQQLETESTKCLEATMKLRESRLTPAERKAGAEETRRGQILFAKLIPELSPSWREEATAAFRNKKLG
jgi:hypothetical protein